MDGEFFSCACNLSVEVCDFFLDAFDETAAEIPDFFGFGYQGGVPKVEFPESGLFMLDSFEEGVSLFEGALVVCEGFKVDGVELDQKAVEKLAAEGGAAVDHKEGFRGEKDYAEGAKKVFGRDE